VVIVAMDKARIVTILFMVSVVSLCRSKLCNSLVSIPVSLVGKIKCINFSLCKSRDGQRKVISEKGEVIEKLRTLFS